jgi:hypothetical protein
MLQFRVSGRLCSKFLESEAMTYAILLTAINLREYTSAGQFSHAYAAARSLILTRVSHESIPSALLCALREQRFFP